MNILSGIQQAFERFRLRLASSQAGVALSVLGLIAGVLAGGVIVLFRMLIESMQGTFIPFGDVENYEALALVFRFGLPFAGAVVIGLWFQWLYRGTRRVGVVHVLERLQYHEGHLPFKNLATQFLAGAISLVCGHSVGREAPSIHLGAATASLFGQYFGLPNNSIRILVACGAAAAIAASFNTPLAGVVFAMEVVMMEYTIAGFTPVILAAVAATIMSRAVFGAASVFYVPPLSLASMWDLPYILFMGVCLGALSAFFVEAIRFFARLAIKVPVGVAITAAGALVGIVAIEIPAVLGMGYDTVNAVLLGDLAIGSVLLILLAKLIASSVCVATGVPGGLIGPTIVMGALVGGLFAYGGDHLPGVTSAHGLFVMLGMGAMMSACLQAPLAGLLALLEMTANPHLILPAMLAVVSANITAREVFKQDSVFAMLMRDAGLDYRNDPISQSLRRTGVASVMNRNFVESDADVEREKARDLLKDTPQRIIVRDDDDERALLPASDLARFLEDHDAEIVHLMDIPAQRRELAPVHMQASMQEARVALADSGAEALFVRREIAPLTFRVFGVLLRQDVESSYALRR
ncbi:MAG: chloride channel protein [Gammaproteobacteria bacterium]|nr:chloride channel protein [Gammaproteobacteria bacterium]